MAEDLTVPDPAPVLDLMSAFRRSKVMFAAVSLGIFDALAAGPESSAALAGKLGCHPEALERLLDACVCLGLLGRQGEDYRNSEQATAYLTSDSPYRLTGYINFSNGPMWKLWANLEGAVREGTHRWKQTFGTDGPIFSHFFETDAAMREFLLGMHGFGMISSPHVVTAFDLSRYTQFIDLGGATGHLAAAACRQYPQMKATVYDLPQAMPLAEEMVSQTTVADRVILQPGDFFTDPLPNGDLFALGRILHDWTEEKITTLLARIFDALPSGGGILIAEKLLREDKSGPEWAHLQSLNMLTCTEGKERTLAEYEALLLKAGFRNVIGRRTPSPLDAVLATKP